MRYRFDDGGRTAAGFQGQTGDCVTRAIAIATGKPYREVYDELNILAASERIGRRKKKKSNSRLGVFPRTYLRYPMRDLRCLRGGEVRRLTYSENLFDPLFNRLPYLQWYGRQDAVGLIRPRSRQYRATESSIVGSSPNRSFCFWLSWLI